MLDKLQRIAQALQALRLPSVVVGFISLASMVAIILTSQSRAGDTYLIPSAVGALWAVTTYSFFAKRLADDILSDFAGPDFAE